MYYQRFTLKAPTALGTGGELSPFRGKTAPIDGGVRPWASRGCARPDRRWAILRPHLARVAWPAAWTFSRTNKGPAPRSPPRWRRRTSRFPAGAATRPDAPETAQP